MLTEKCLSIFSVDNISITNRLSFDVEFFARKYLGEAKEKIGHIYPSHKGVMPVAYYWARTVKCTNPSCGADVPMLKQFYLSNNSRHKVYMNPIITGVNIDFEIKNGTCSLKGWNNRGNITCPCCGATISVSDVKNQSNTSGLGLRLIARIEDNGRGKEYFLADKSDNPEIKIDHDSISSASMQRNSGGGDTFSWGITKWTQLFLDRQLYAISTLSDIIKNHPTDGSPYSVAVKTYLALWLDRVGEVHICSLTIQRLDLRSCHHQHWKLIHRRLYEVVLLLRIHSELPIISQM